VNWLREKGARRIALLAPRVDASWPRDTADVEIRVCRCDVGDAGELARVLDELATSGGIAGRFIPLAYWLMGPCRSSMTTSWPPFSRSKRRRQASYCKPCATTADVI
jgi:yersiniabactin nonribosomal peptide/polyketide synthase